jgi:hypothetical protein
MENPKILIKIHVNDPAFSQERIEEVKEMAIEFVESLGICAQLIMTIPKTEDVK